MDPDYMRRKAENIQQALNSGVYDGIREALNSGVYDGIREALDKGVYDGIREALAGGVSSGIREALNKGIHDNFLHKVAQDLENSRQAAQTEPFKSILEDLGPTGIGSLAFGNANIADLAVGNVNVAEAALANVNVPDLVARDLLSVAEEAQSRWLSDSSGQALLRNALLGLTEDHYEPIRQAVELVSDPKVREMVKRGNEEPQNEALIEQLLQHHERQDPLTVEDHEANNEEQAITAQMLSRVMLLLLYVQFALSAAHAIPGAEADTDILKGIISSLIALCGYMMTLKPASEREEFSRQFNKRYRDTLRDLSER